jgi:hypothetical protein
LCVHKKYKAAKHTRSSSCFSVSHLELLPQPQPHVRLQAAVLRSGHLGKQPVPALPEVDTHGALWLLQLRGIGSVNQSLHACKMTTSPRCAHLQQRRAGAQGGLGLQHTRLQPHCVHLLERQVLARGYQARLRLGQPLLPAATEGMHVEGRIASRALSMPCRYSCNSWSPAAALPAAVVACAPAPRPRRAAQPATSSRPPPVRANAPPARGTRPAAPEQTAQHRDSQRVSLGSVFLERRQSTVLQIVTCAPTALAYPCSRTCTEPGLAAMAWMSAPSPKALSARMTRTAVD